MTDPFNIGVLQLSMEPVHETVAMAKACEDAGFDTFWIAEAYPWWRKHSFEARSSTAILAVIASQTKRIQLGWGIISPYTRHPVQIAMEARVMQDLAGDRFLLGLGASKIFMKEIGEGEGEKVGPATVMRESIEIIRGVLQGDAVRISGKSLSPQRSAAQVRRAHFAQRSSDVCCRNWPGDAEAGWFARRWFADGRHHHAGVRALLEEEHGRGRGESGQRSGKLILGWVIVGSIGRDSKKGKEGAREQAAMYLANKVQNIKGSADVLLRIRGHHFRRAAAGCGRHGKRRPQSRRAGRQR